MFRSPTTLLVALLLPTTAAAGTPQPLPVLHRALITEVMVEPAGVEAGTGQWIELFNPFDQPLNIQGLTLQTQTGPVYPINLANELILPAGGFLVLGRSADEAINGGVHVDHAYGGAVLLQAEADTVTLLSGTQVVDAFSYGPDIGPYGLLQVKTGVSLSREPPANPDAMPDWCYGRTVYGGGGNLGTPGAANTWCDDDGDGAAEDQGDCDDTSGTVHPGATEACNGLDDDCNGLTDDGLVPPACLTRGVCEGATATCQGKAGFVCGYPASYEVVETSCDGLDNDCDGLIDYDVQPPESTSCLQAGVCAGAAWICSGAKGFICTYPATWEVTEASCDGLDNDCDGLTDEGFNLGAACTSGAGACRRSGQRVCADDGKSAVCSAVPGEASPEICDGLDNDCNGLTDEGFVDATHAVGGVCTAGTGACAVTGKYRCSDDGKALVCSAIPGPPTGEVCADGIDNDCDGETDEADCTDDRGHAGGCGATGRGAGAAGLLLPLLTLAVFRRRRAL